MPFAAHPLNVAILAVPAVGASTLFGMVDLFSTAGRDWSLLLSASKANHKPVYRSVQQTGFAATNGVWVRPHYSLDDTPTPDIVCVPDFSAVPVAPRPLTAEVASLRGPRLVQQ